MGLISSKQFLAERKLRKEPCQCGKECGKFIEPGDVRTTLKGNPVNPDCYDESMGELIDGQGGHLGVPHSHARGAH